LKEELVMESAGIRNLHPAPGEPAFFPNPPARSVNSTVDESYALITHTPGVKGKGDVLYLSGTHASSPTAGVEAFTDPALARTVVEHLRKPGGKLPRYYQILLKVKSMDEGVEWCTRFLKVLGGGECELRPIMEAADFPPEVATHEVIENDKKLRAQMQKNAAGK